MCKSVNYVESGLNGSNFNNCLLTKLVNRLRTERGKTHESQLKMSSVFQCWKLNFDSTRHSGLASGRAQISASAVLVLHS